MELVKAPNYYKIFDHEPAVFLGGSIEMGSAEHWKKRVAEYFSEYEHLLILDPQRDDWDSSWDQSPVPGTKFHEQVTWEMKAQEDADLLIYYFSPGTKSPITLLELGLYGRGGRTIVCCPPEFWRYGNVKMTCDRYGIHLVENFDDLLTETEKFIGLIEQTTSKYTFKF